MILFRPFQWLQSLNPASWLNFPVLFLTLLSYYTLVCVSYLCYRHHWFGCCSSRGTISVYKIIGKTVWSVVQSIKITWSFWWCLWFPESAPYILMFYSISFLFDVARSSGNWAGLPFLSSPKRIKLQLYVVWQTTFWILITFLTAAALWFEPYSYYPRWFFILTLAIDILVFLRTLIIWQTATSNDMNAQVESEGAMPPQLNRQKCLDQFYLYSEILLEVLKYCRTLTPGVMILSQQQQGSATSPSGARATGWFELLGLALLLPSAVPLWASTLEIPGGNPASATTAPTTAPRSLAAPVIPTNLANDSRVYRGMYFLWAVQALVLVDVIWKFSIVWSSDPTLFSDIFKKITHSQAPSHKPSQSWKLLYDRFLVAWRSGNPSLFMKSSSTNHPKAFSSAPLSPSAPSPSSSHSSSPPSRSNSFSRCGRRSSQNCRRGSRRDGEGGEGIDIVKA